MDERTFTGGDNTFQHKTVTAEDVLKSVTGLRPNFPPFVGIELRVDPNLVASQHYMMVSQKLFDALEKQNELYSSNTTHRNGDI